MGRVTVLLSGLPTYVTLVDLSYYLEYLFNTNTEIGTFELRHLTCEDNKLVALDFRSGFDAIAAQEQLDGYRYEMPDGIQYILRAKVTNKKEYLRSDSSPESRRRSRSPSEDSAWMPLTLTPNMSDGAMARANAKLDAKYKLLQKQKLIVQSEMELIRERRKLRREYAQAENSDSGDEPTGSRHPSEHRSWSQELDLFKLRLASKIQDLKVMDCRSKETASTSKRRSPSWDIEQSRSPGRVKSKPSSRERSLRQPSSGSVRPRVHRSRSLSRSPQSKSRSRERRAKSRVRTRALNSRSLSRSPYKSRSRERSLKYKSKTRSRALRSRSFTRSPRNTKSRSRSVSYRSRRSRSRRQRCKERPCSRDTESRDKRMGRSRHRSFYKRLRSPDSCSRGKRLRSPDSFRGKRLWSPDSSRGKRLRSPDSGSRGKRLRSPDSCSRGKRLRSPDSGSRGRRLRSPEGGSRSRRPRSRGRLLAIMPRSPARETAVVRTQANRSKVDKSDLEITARNKRTKRDNTPKHTDNNKNNLFGTEETSTEAQIMTQINVKTKSDLPTKSCTQTSVTVKENATKKIKYCQNNVTQPVSVHTYAKQNSNDEDNINIANKKITSKDTRDNTDSSAREDANNTKKESAQRKLKIKEIMMQSMCNDIMFLMQSLLLEILVKENITLSDSNARLLKERLNLLIKERVEILYDEEQISILNACENYRQICTKQDDTLLLIQMLDELKTQEADLTISQNNPSSYEKAADDSHVNTNQKVSDDEPATVTHVSKEETITNKDEDIEQKGLEKSSDNKTSEVIEVIDIETYYCPKESSNTGALIKDKPIPACPMFVLVIKKLMKQLKPVIYMSRGYGVYVNYFDMKQVLRILLTDILQGQGYKTTSQIIAMFRQIYPRYHDVDFVKKVAEDIKMKKYDLSGMDNECQDDDEVQVLENKHEVVVISDDETDDIRDNILYIINNLNEMSANEKIKEDFNCNYLSDMEKIEAAFSMPDDNNLKESDLIGHNDCEKINVAVNNITETKESEKTNEADNTIEITENCNTVVKQELEEQQSETVQNQDKTADSMVTKEVHETETESDPKKEEKTHESLKVTAITIMTSETELHSIANAIENGSIEDPKDNIKEEIDSELTDAEIDKILSLDNFSLDILNVNATDACENDDKILDMNNIRSDKLNACDPCEKETPQVISVTITTSVAELFALKYDGDEKTPKEVPEVKIENNEEINNKTQEQEQLQDDENVEQVGDTGGVGETVDAEMSGRSEQDKPQDKRPPEDEEETIESICKYLTSFCNDVN